MIISLFRFFELLIETKILNREDLKSNINFNNFTIDKNKKKKNSKSFLCFKISEILGKYKQEFNEEIKNTVNLLNNLEIKNLFFTSEANYEEVNINDNYGYKNNLVNTRNRNNILNNLSNLNFTRVTTHDRNKNFPFDFHIKNLDDNSFEKIVID
jgi:hypothetical protein